MRTLKILVVVMGVLLVGGVAALIAVVANRLGHRQPVPVPAQPLEAPPLDLPAGARIESIGVGNDRLVIAVVLADGSRQLMILDLATGRRVGSIPLRMAP